MPLLWSYAMVMANKDPDGLCSQGKTGWDTGQEYTCLRNGYTFLQRYLRIYLVFLYDNARLTMSICFRGKPFNNLLMYYKNYRY